MAHSGPLPRGEYVISSSLFEGDTSAMRSETMMIVRTSMQLTMPTISSIFRSRSLA
jgi:hypothetical protein